jgi:hypothetical protein
MASWTAAQARSRSFSVTTTGAYRLGSREHDKGTRPLSEVVEAPVKRDPEALLHRHDRPAEAASGDLNTEDPSDVAGVPRPAFWWSVFGTSKVERTACSTVPTATSRSSLSRRLSTPGFRSRDLATTEPPRLRLAAVHVARIPPQDALQLLIGEPAPQPSSRVLFGSFDERLTEAPVQAGAALAGGFGSRLVWINHDHEDSDWLPRGAAPASFAPSVFHME